MRTRSTVRAPWLVLGVATLAIVIAGSAMAANRQDEKDRITNSASVVRALVKTPDDGIPDYILERAEAIVVIPTLVKGGFIFGAQHGKGVVSVRDRATNTWSYPAFVSLTGGSIGWQIGVQSVDRVLLVMNRDGIKDLFDSNFKLGTDASVAAGPVGRQGEAATDAKFSAKILAYSRAKGLFAGLALEGAALTIDDDANKSFYGSELSDRRIVSGKGAPATPEGREFTRTLTRLVPTQD